MQNLIMYYYFPRYTSYQPKGEKVNLKFGQTFWGQQWLNALKNIDYSNRLSRGSNYARRGTVVHKETKGNQIYAKVQGSQRTPYGVTIKIPLFTEAQKKAIIDFLVSNPAWLAELLNGTLPAELLKETEKRNIKLFPSAWNDLDMKCSCPDWAVPCKHLAAVIYMISCDIDIDPMLVLQMHGLDITAELKKRNLDISQSLTEKIPDFFTTVKAAKKEVSPPAAPVALLDDLPDYSKIPEAIPLLPELLPDAPAFCHENAKKALIGFLKNFRKYWMKYDLSADDYNLKTYKEAVSIALHYDTKTNQTVVQFRGTVEKKETALADFITDMYSIAQEECLHWCDDLKLLREFFLLSHKLLETAQVIPQLAELEGKTMVFWYPLVRHEAVKAVFAKMNAGMPVMNVYIKGKGQKTLSAPADAERLVALFLTSMSVNFGNTGNRKTEYKILDPVFASCATPFPDNAAALNALQIWLKLLNPGRTRFSPSVRIEEQNAGFRLTLCISDRERSTHVPEPLSSFLKKKKNHAFKMEILKNLVTLQTCFPQISNLVNEEKDHLALGAEEILTVLCGLIPQLQFLGIQVILPKNLAAAGRPRPFLLAKTGSVKGSPGFLSLADLMSFEWMIAIGEQHISVSEFQKLTSGYKGLIKFRDEYVILDPAEIARLQQQLEKPYMSDKTEILRALLAGEVKGHKIELSPAVRKALDAFRKVRKIKLPKGLIADMRPYQVRGYEWLVKNSGIGFGSILADDMGLGKTLQAIALLMKMKNENALKKTKALVIAPTTLLTNWQKEILKFAPKMESFIYHGLKREFPDKAEYDVLLTSYGTLRNDVDFFEKKQWKALIIDEAQNIKNHNTLQTKAVKKLKAEVKIALSGTPVENRLSEYWSIMDFANKGLLGNAKWFGDTFADPIQREHDLEKTELFRRLTGPFIMRRMKTDKKVIADLPDKIENNVYSALTKQQAALYQSVAEKGLEDIKRSEGISRRGQVLKMMIALKQIGNHPVQYLKQGKVEPESSGKLQMLMDLIAPVLDANEKMLIFTQYKEMGDILSDVIGRQLNVPVLFLHGGTTRKQRDEMVNVFQERYNQKVFILSLKAGGTGLNLTAATHVFHYDLWWNPAVENQATDRAYRIGQHKNVMVHRLINRGTLEEKIDAMISAKKELAALTVTTGEKWLGELSNSEIKELVSLEK
jgi:uncharacterized Zn finger protein/superfamily II DNA or RNA helicase